MNTDDFKIILDEALKPITERLDDPKTGLKIINKKLEDLDSMKVDLDSIKQQISDPKTGLKRINEKLDALWDQTVELTTDAEETKEILKSQNNGLRQTNDNVVKIDKRLIIVESNLGISTPPELSIV